MSDNDGEYVFAWEPSYGWVLRLEDTLVKKSESEPIYRPHDFAAEERRRMLEDSQPLNSWGVFLALVTSLGFWFIVLGVLAAIYR